MKPVQILMAVFNGERYVASQIDSILAQSYAPLRLLIRDNASTDGTWSILQRYAADYPERVVVMPRNTENIGALGNFAAVFNAADEGYVMFADADDVWRRDKAQAVMDRLTELEEQHGTDTPILVHSDLSVVDADLTTIDASFWHFQKIDPVKGCEIGRLLVCGAVTGCTLVMNSALVRLARPIPVSAAIMHDYWISLVAASFGVIGHVDRPLIDYRQHGRNDTGAKRWDGSLSAVLRKPWNPFNRASTHVFRSEMAQHYRQARAFLELHGARLSAPLRAQISAFVQLSERSFLARRALVIRHGFWKTGLIRNISLLTRI